MRVKKLDAYIETFQFTMENFGSMFAGLISDGDEID
jgi:hypothetical protein